MKESKLTIFNDECKHAPRSGITTLPTSQTYCSIKSSGTIKSNNHDGRRVKTTIKCALMKGGEMAAEWVKHKLKSEAKNNRNMKRRKRE